MMKRYGGFKYKIRILNDGQYLFEIWPADANVRSVVATWHRVVKAEAEAERFVKQWIDGQRPPRRKRPRPKGRR